MAKQTYFPKKKGDQVIWYGNHRVKIAIEGATIGLTPAEILARQVSCQACIDRINLTAQKKQELEDQYELERALLSTENTKIFNGVARDKTHAAWTTGIGQNLGEVGDEDARDFAAMTPKLTLSKIVEGWKITFNLGGHFTAVWIERKRPAGNWEFLAIDTSSPYLDTDTQVDATEYRAVYMFGDVKNPSWGPVETVKL